jgi:hypothetical protein
MIDCPLTCHFDDVSFHVSFVRSLAAVQAVPRVPESRKLVSFANCRTA